MNRLYRYATDSLILLGAGLAVGGVVFRYSESTSGPIIKPQWPLVLDLIDDPVEE